MRGLAVAVALAVVAVAAGPAAGARLIKPGGATSGQCATVATACDYTYVLNGHGSAPNDAVTVLAGTYDVTAQPVVLARPLRIRGSGATRPSFLINTTGASAATFSIPSAAAGSALSHLSIRSKGFKGIDVGGQATLDDLDVMAQAA